MALMMKPGWALLIAGVGSYIISRFIGVVPLIGGIVATMAFLFAIFAVIGGIWLIVADARAAD